MIADKIRWACSMFYPSWEKMVNDSTTKVSNSERNISMKKVTQPEDDSNIRVFEAYQSIVDAVKKRMRKTWNQNGSLYIKVHQVHQNSRHKHKKPRKQLKKASVVQDSKQGCAAEKIAKHAEFYSSVNLWWWMKKTSLANGSCKTYNTCYRAKCQICKTCFTGRTALWGRKISDLDKFSRN